MPEPEAEEEVEEILIPAHNRKRRGRKTLADHLPRVEVVHDIENADNVCGCGCELSRIGEEVSEQLDVIPAKVRVIRHIRPKYTCKGCEGVSANGPVVKIAPVPPQIIPRSIASLGLLAHILTSKFVDHTPFYRQETQFGRLGVELSRSSMCNWAMQAAAACQSILNLIQDEILSGISINIDETTLQVSQEPGRSPTSTSYMWIFRRGDPGNSALIYHLSPRKDVTMKI